MYGLCSRVIYWDAMSSFGIWEKTAWLCLSLRFSGTYCLFSWAPYPFCLYLACPTRLCLLKFFQVFFPVSPFTIPIFHFHVQVSLLLPIYHVSPSLFPISENLPHPFSTSLRNSRVDVDCMSIYSTEHSWTFLFLAVGARQDEQQ